MEKILLSMVSCNTKMNTCRFEPAMLSSELEEMGARILGKEACKYFPTGLMGNLASVMSHTWERGSEVLLGDLSHINLYEQGGASIVSHQFQFCV
jgi:threonine aldolase